MLDFLKPAPNVLVAADPLPPVREKLISKMIPSDARLMLIRASLVEVTPRQPLARLKAIEAATQAAQARYPHLFY